MVMMQICMIATCQALYIGHMAAGMSLAALKMRMPRIISFQKIKRTRSIRSIATRRLARFQTINTNTGGRTTEVEKALANSKAVPARKDI
jgi:hypothetical protein